MGWFVSDGECYGNDAKRPECRLHPLQGFFCCDCWVGGIRNGNDQQVADHGQGKNKKRSNHYRMKNDFGARHGTSTQKVADAGNSRQGPKI